MGWSINTIRSISFRVTNMYINDLVSDIMIFLYNKREYICCHVTDSKMNFKVFTLNQRNHCYFTGTQSLNTCTICWLWWCAFFKINNTMYCYYSQMHTCICMCHNVNFKLSTKTCWGKYLYVCVNTSRYFIPNTINKQCLCTLQGMCDKRSVLSPVTHSCIHR